MYIYEFKYVYCDEPIAYDPMPVVPKNWRWYDVFRTWKKLELLYLVLFSSNVLMLVKNIQSIRQRNKQKRRSYVQKLLS